MKTALWWNALLAVMIVLGGLPACSDDDDDDDTTTLPNDDDDDDTGDDTAPLCGDTECQPSEACIDDICVEVNREEIERGCHPLNEGHCMYPWPSNFSTAADPDSATGLRLDYDPAVMPVNDAGEEFPSDQYGHFDGFSPNSQIRFVFPEDVDGSNLPPIDAVDLSLEEDSPTILLNMDTGERAIHFAEVDANDFAEGRRAIFIRPMKRLDFASRYVVAVRGLRNAEGDLIEPSPLFRALRDGLETDVRQIEAMRGDYEDIFAALEEAGIARESVQLAWDFTTVSNLTMTGYLRDILPDFKSRAADGDLGYTINQVQEDPNTVLKYIVTGTFKAPSYMTNNGEIGGVIATGEDGHAAYQGLIDIPFYMAVPRSVWDAGVPVPVFLYGHGLFGTGSEVLFVTEIAGPYIGMAVDFQGMSAYDIGFLVNQIFAHNMRDGHAMPHRLLQATVNFATLGYLANGDMALDPILQKDGVSMVDTTQLYYVGGSQGGIMGGTMMAFFPHITRGVLVVGGGTYSLMVFRSSNWPGFDNVWEAFHEDPLEREFLFSVFQSQFDYAEAPIYADHIKRDPFPGNPPKEIMLVEALGDCQVPNISTEMMARTYGLTMRAPGIYDVPGVPNNFDTFTGSALVLEDTGRRPLAPSNNVPPEDDTGAHGASADSPAIQEMIRTFMRTGEVVHTCDGPCDPE